MLFYKIDLTLIDENSLPASRDRDSFRTMIHTNSIAPSVPIRWYCVMEIIIWFATMKTKRTWHFFVWRRSKTPCR